MSPKLIRKIHTKWIVNCSILLTTFGLCGFSISSGYWMLFIFAIPYGLGAGVIDSAVNHYAANNYSGSGFGYAGADYDIVYGKVTCAGRKMRTDILSMTLLFRLIRRQALKSTGLKKEY